MTNGSIETAGTARVSWATPLASDVVGSLDTSRLEFRTIDSGERELRRAVGLAGPIRKRLVVLWKNGAPKSRC
jgi:hypothetical protein